MKKVVLSIATALLVSACGKFDQAPCKTEYVGIYPGVGTEKNECLDTEK